MHTHTETHTRMHARRHTQKHTSPRCRPFHAYCLGFGASRGASIQRKEFSSFSSVTTAHGPNCKAGGSWHPAQAWPDSFINPALTAAQIAFHDTKPSCVIHLMPRFTVPKTKEPTDRVSGLCLPSRLSKGQLWVKLQKPEE